MPATVDALLPLSLLNAVRQIDAADGWFELDHVPELRNKRLGLSDTVQAQIRRYSEAVRRGQRTDAGDAEMLARLVGRRPDAGEIFRAAGVHLAAAAYRTISPVARRSLLSLPALVARPLALRQARRLLRRYANGTVARVGSSVLLRVPAPLTRSAATAGIGCVFYESLLHELVSRLLGGAGSVEHVRCAMRGETTCEWRVDWRTMARAA